MNYTDYQKKLNDIITKCPIEAGVEILVYNLIDELNSENTKLTLVNINSIEQDNDSRLQTPGGIPDLAMVSDDFIFGQSIGNSYGFIEIKATNINLRLTGQIKGHIESKKPIIYTNGLQWKFFNHGKESETLMLTTDNLPYTTLSQPVEISKTAYKKLIETIQGIKWNT